MEGSGCRAHTGQWKMSQATLQPSTSGMGNPIPQMLESGINKGLSSYNEEWALKYIITDHAKIMAISCGHKGVFVGVSQAHWQVCMNTSLMTTPREWSQRSGCSKANTYSWARATSSPPPLSLTLSAGDPWHKAKYLNFSVISVPWSLCGAGVKSSLCSASVSPSTEHERWGRVSFVNSQPSALHCIFFFFLVLMPKKILY